MDERERRCVLMSAEMSVAGLAPDLVRVRDISEGGAKVAARFELRIGQRVVLTLPRVGRVDATVVWAKDKLAGLSFDGTIDAQLVLREITVSKTPAPPPAPEPILRRV